MKATAMALAFLALLGFACGAIQERERKMTKKPLSVGDPAPDFTAQSTTGKISLAELRGKQVVLYFYPKDATPG